MTNDNKNKINKNYKEKRAILTLLAKHTRNLRGEQRQFMFCSENDIAPSTISTIERIKKDPQLTTVFKIAQAFNMKTWEFIKLIDEDLPDGFSMIDL